MINVTVIKVDDKSYTVTKLLLTKTVMIALFHQ